MQLQLHENCRSRYFITAVQCYLRPILVNLVLSRLIRISGILFKSSSRTGNWGSQHTETCSVMELALCNTLFIAHNIQMHFCIVCTLLIACHRLRKEFPIQDRESSLIAVQSYQQRQELEKYISTPLVDKENILLKVSSTNESVLITAILG